MITDVEKKLSHRPQVQTSSIKRPGFEPANFSHLPPPWKLKTGDLRVFYSVDEDEFAVYLHAVRRKPPEQTTDEVLNEKTPD